MTDRQKNNLFGWGVFLASLLVYVLTLEPTMSLWDCGEFLVSAYKLEISHAPGAPLFMLIGRIFSLAALDHQSKAAAMVNLVSAVSAAATVMFLFWTAVWLMKRYLSTDYAAIWVSAAIGALGFAFTDSFWFSAVEAEVYSMSSLFIAMVLWAATRWEREADDPAANRWILLIFFLTGLSIGVHLLNLLVIPTIALIVFFRLRTYSLKGVTLTLAGSFALIMLMMKVYIPGLFSLAGPLELFAVNTLRLPVNSGFYCYLTLVASAFVWAIRYTQNRKKANWNLAVLCLLFLTVGYTSYLTVFIRSAANPPVNQGNPETTFSLINYLNRESYGTRPFLYGESFGSVAENYEKRMTWVYDGDQYVPVELNPKVRYYSGMVGLFPRMHSREKDHVEAYHQWTNMKGKKVSYQDGDGLTKTTILPTLAENLKFFLNYQLGHMYLRYFMWNFAGKQDDVQGFGGPLNGNWLSGITFLDKYRLGQQHDLPGGPLQNKGRNRYFFLPLTLGLAGGLFHYRREKKSFGSFLLLFLMTGVGLVVYLNEVPDTPRERDYVYVGSFYIFSIWIGIGVLALFDRTRHWLNRKAALILAAAAGILAAPAILIGQNYDDHDRSGRYTARDLARNYLMSCEPNAILFTHADNDTYPLWYCQEVEGIRRDVRIIVMPYLAANWYLRQISRTVYDNPGVKLTVPLIKYETGKVNYLPVVPMIKTEQDMRDVLTFAASDSSQAKVDLQSGGQLNYIPVNKIRIGQGNDSISIVLDKSCLFCNDLAFWDIIASNAGRRPVCFTSWYDAQNYGLQDHLRFDGLIYTLVPDSSHAENPLDMGRVEAERLYKNLLEKCNWENMKDTSVYFDWHHRRMFAVVQIRQAFYRLAESLIKKNEPDRARHVIGEAMSILPFNLWPVDYYSCLLNEALLKTGKDAGGIALLKEQTRNLEEWLDYLGQFENRRFRMIEQEYLAKLYLYRELYNLAVQYDPNLAEEMRQRFDKLKHTIVTGG